MPTRAGRGVAGRGAADAGQSGRLAWLPTQEGSSLWVRGRPVAGAPASLAVQTGRAGAPAARGGIGSSHTSPTAGCPPHGKVGWSKAGSQGVAPLRSPCQGRRARVRPKAQGPCGHLPSRRAAESTKTSHSCRLSSSPGAHPRQSGRAAACAPQATRRFPPDPTASPPSREIAQSPTAWQLRGFAGSVEPQRCPQPPLLRSPISSVGATPVPHPHPDTSLVLTNRQELEEASNPRHPRGKQEGDHGVAESPQDGEGQLTQVVVPVRASFHDPHPMDLKNVSGLKPPDAEPESQSLSCHIQDQEGSSSSGGRKPVGHQLG